LRSLRGTGRNFIIGDFLEMLIGSIRYLTSIQESLIESGAKRLKDAQRGAYYNAVVRGISSPSQQPIKNDRVREAVKAALKAAAQSCQQP
jgi:hypothetical protein